MGNLLMWSSMVLHARSQYLASDFQNLTESKPDVNFHFQLGTHFWIVVPKIDPEKFDPRDYEDIENTVKSQARFRHAEDMNQFRSCKEHADINDELFYKMDRSMKWIDMPIHTREKELELSKTDCSVVLVQRSTEIQARELHHHPEKRTCNGLLNYCGKGGSCARTNKMAVLHDKFDSHKDFVKRRSQYDSDLKAEYGQLKGEWRTTGHWTHVRNIVVRDKKDHWLRILSKPRHEKNGNKNHQEKVHVTDYHSKLAEFTKKYNISRIDALYEVADRMGFKDKCRCEAGFSGPRCEVKGGTTESPTTEAKTATEPTTLRPTTEDVTTPMTDIPEQHPSTYIPFPKTTVTPKQIPKQFPEQQPSTHKTLPKTTVTPKRVHPTKIFWYLMLVGAIGFLCFFRTILLFKIPKKEKQCG